MYQLTNITPSSLTVGDLRFEKGGRHNVDALNKEIISAVRGQRLAANPPIFAVADALTDNSGGAASGTIAVITDGENTGSADLVPTANSVASLAAQVNALKYSIDGIYSDLI